MALPSFYILRGVASEQARISPAVGKALAFPTLTSLKGFFTNNKNKCTRFTRLTNGVDKTLKISIAVCELGKAITDGQESSVATHQGFSNVYQSLYGARTVIGLFNAFNGALPGAVQDGLQAARLTRDFCKNSVGLSAVYDPSLEKEKVYLHNQIAVGKREQGLAAFSSGMRCIGSGTFVLSFGIFRTLGWAHKMTPFLGSHAKAIGKTANTLMVINHAAVLAGTTADIVREHAAYTRVKGFIEKDNALNDTAKAEKKTDLSRAYRDTLIGCILALIEKIGEFFLDIVKAVAEFGAMIPLEARAAISIGIGLIGIYKVWRGA